MQAKRMREAEKNEFKPKVSKQSGAGETGSFHSPAAASLSHLHPQGTSQHCQAHRHLLLYSDSFSCRAAMARRRCSFSCSISRSERTLM